MFYKHNTITVFVAVLVWLMFPVLPAADKADDSGKSGKSRVDEKEGAEEVAPQPVEITGRVYKGRRLQPKLDFYFVHDLPEKTGRRSSRKKKSDIAKASAQLDSLFKQYKKKQRALEKLIKDREEDKRKTKEEYRTQPAKHADKSLKDALHDINGDYESRIDSARDTAQDEANALVKAFENIVHDAKLGGSLFLSCASDANGNYKITLPQAGTYYILVPEPLSLEHGDKGLFLSRISVTADGGEIAIELKPEYVLEKNVKL